jgi:hypothetical protein
MGAQLGECRPVVLPVDLLLHAQDGTEKSRQVFITVPTEVGQTEAEEIGAASDSTKRSSS